MKTLKELRECIIQQLEDFKIEAQPEQKKEKFVQIENMLIELIKKEIQAVNYYLWGLLYYFSDRPDQHQKAIKKFENSLQIDNQYYMARMYIGHCYFDLKCWNLALEAFQMVNQRRLQSEFPLWRVIKLQELIGVCHYRLQEKILGQVQFSHVIKVYRENTYTELARPTEMMSLLEEEGEVSSLQEIKMLIEEE